MIKLINILSERHKNTPNERMGKWKNRIKNLQTKINKAVDKNSDTVKLQKNQIKVIQQTMNNFKQSQAIKKQKSQTKLSEILKEQKEFIIWGVPPGERDEVVAYTKAKSMPEAKKVMDILKLKHGLTKLRVQVIDLSQTYDLKKSFTNTLR